MLSAVTIHSFRRALLSLLLPALACLPALLAHSSADAQGQVVGQLPVPGPPVNFPWEQFYALTPQGSVYILDYNPTSGILTQSSQAAWGRPTLSAIAAMGNRGFLGILANGSIFYINTAPNATGPYLLNSEPAIESNALYYFGCNLNLYTVLKNGDLYERTLSGIYVKNVKPVLSASQKVGNGWQSDTATCISNDFLHYDYIVLKNANGDFYGYNHFGGTQWSTMNLHANFNFIQSRNSRICGILLPCKNPAPPSSQPVNIIPVNTFIGDGVVLVTRPSPLVPGQYAVFPTNSTETAWENPLTTAHPVTGSVNLAGFKQVVYGEPAGYPAP